MNCLACKGGNMTKGFDSYFAKLKTGYLIVENVPCLKCDQCGETYFTDAVAERLEKIVNETKKFMQEVSIIDYNKAA